jgi:uncharacterized membrane protein
MKRNKHLIIGLIFLILSGIVLYTSTLTATFFPTQELELSKDLEFIAVTKDLLVIQEVSVKKEYLTAVELAMVSSGLPYLNENTLIVLDTNYQTLYTKHFTYDNLNRPQYQLFEFPEKIHIGKGKKVIICISSTTGDKASHLSVPWTTAGKFGKLTVKPLINADVIGTMKGTGKVFPMEGSIGLRTYESNYGSINWFKTFLFLVAALLALFIVFEKNIRNFIAQLTIVPEKIYLILALVFGLSLVFIAPPLQVPDEIDHLNRAYQLTELDIFQYNSTVPASLMQLFDNYAKMNYDTFKKNSIDKVQALRKVELNPDARTTIFVRPFIFPYFPQALGISLGKIFNCSPVMLLYIGRIFNLLFSIGLIYLAIRTAPVLKWTFSLLGLMPMTLFLCASLSKDAMIIGLSFLLIALLLRFAYGQQKKIGTRDLIILFAIAFLVAASRSIYAILIGMFILVPAEKIGSLKKYFIIFISLIITVILATQISALKPLFQPKAANPTQQAMNNSLLTDAPSTRIPSTFDYFRQSDRPNLIPEGINYNKQKNFIMNNPVQYAEILFRSVFISERDFILNSFIGIMGWYRHLPNWLINLYFLTLLITALIYSSPDIRITTPNKIIIACLFIAGVILIETGLYLAWNPVGQKNIIDVQGRYFIPYAPLFFLLLYNTSLGGYLNRFFASRKKKQFKVKQKIMAKRDYLLENNKQVILHNSLDLLIICFCIISLLTTVYVLLKSYYVILI